MRNFGLVGQINVNPKRTPSRIIHCGSSSVSFITAAPPICCRPTLAQARSDTDGIYFGLARTKTDKAAATTLTRWSLAMLVAYLKLFGAELMDSTPLLWTRGGRPAGRDGASGQWGGDHSGGRHIAPRPYTKSSLNQEFRTIHELTFGKDETRQLQDIRRSGAIEGDAGGASIEDQSNKMANTVDRNKQLRKTYNPVNVPSVRRFDQARVIGVTKLAAAEQNATERVIDDPCDTFQIWNLR